MRLAIISLLIALAMAKVIPSKTLNALEPRFTSCCLYVPVRFS
jgi:hypothetical protein